jgi:hypothetical protein
MCQLEASIYALTEVMLGRLFAVGGFCILAVVDTIVKLLLAGP